jgi:hypothetical protein
MSFKLGQTNELLSDLGIKRKLPTEFEFKDNDNKELNKYMEYQIRRLERVRDAGNGRKFWFLAWILMNKSVAFKVSAINKVFPKWYKAMPLTYVFKIISKVEKIFRSGDTNMEYKRVYIPKANGGVRPLGVPRHAWRVCLHMQAAFMALFLHGKLHENQHAYQTKKGTTTAWASLLRKVNKYRYIYEIDLRNCFNEINARWVSVLLEKHGVPKAYTDYLERLNASSPKFPEEIQQIDESAYNHRATMLKMASQNPAIIGPTQGIIGAKGNGSVWKFGRPGASNQFVPWTFHKGLPQGSPLSPILTALVLNDFTKQAEDSVFYADDGIFFSNRAFRIEDDERKGIYLSPTKCGWVKYNGVWKNKLKFLGISLNKGKLKGATRNGSTLEIGGKLDKLIYFLKFFRPSYANLEGIWNKTSLGGNIQSKIYSGSWETPVYETKLTMEGVKKSWLKSKRKRDNYVTTSSEACYALSQLLYNRRNRSTIKTANIKVMSSVTKAPKAPKHVFIKNQLRKNKARGK